ncbi:MFS transporter [Actinoplanes sp. NPDC020271]|uniref:MFS transporter n=1 Tax=Actinoplanes sp. NPDC020271 TaxID=3363896 RepID=UPI003796A8E3
MPGLWTDADFRRLWTGQTASQWGEQTGLVVLPLLAVLTLGVGADQLGVLRAAGQLPLLLFALLAGRWVDRRRTRAVMIWTDLGRAVTLGATVVAALVGGLGLPVLLLVAFTVGTLSVFFDVAYQASLVRLVRRDDLLRATSAVEGTRSAAQIGGPALGGALVSLLPAVLTVVPAALMFAVSSVSLARIRRREPIVAAGPRRIRDGVRFVAADRSLRAICLASAAFQFFFAATTTVYLLFLPRELHLSGTAIGVALASAGPGALAGSLLAARLPARFGYGRVLLVAALAGDGVMLLAPLLHGRSVLGPAAIGFVFGTGGQLVNVTVMAVRQSVTPPALQGRVAATITFAGMGLTPIGSLLGGFLAGQLELRTALLCTTAGMLLSPLLMALSPLARLRTTF